MAERPTRISHGVYAGEWADILWKMMQHLSFTKRPAYQGYKYIVGQQERWRVEVILYSNLAPDTSFHIFDAPMRRETFEDGIQDAAREAVRRLRYTYDAHFRDTAFQYYPMHIPTRLGSAFSSVENEDMPEITHQVELAKAMDYAYGNTLDELYLVQGRLEAAEEKLKAAEAELALYKKGQGSTCNSPDYTPSTP